MYTYHHCFFGVWLFFYIHMYMKFIQQFGIVSLFLRNISSLPALLGDDSGLASTESIIVILWLKMDLYEYHCEFNFIVLVRITLAVQYWVYYSWIMVAWLICMTISVSLISLYWSGSHCQFSTGSIMVALWLRVDLYDHHCEFDFIVLTRVTLLSVHH